jgi:hypothetical protein
MYKSTGIFLKTDERINLVLPVVFLVLLVIGFSADSFLKRVFGDSSGLAQRIFADIIFLNVTHNAFTVMMIASFPELRPWISEQGRGSERRFVLRTVAIFVGLFAFIAVALLSEARWVYGVFGVVSIFFPIQHALAQSLGLSLVYNSRVSDAAAGNWPLKKKGITEWIERRLVAALILLVVGSVIAIQLPFFSNQVARGDFGLTQNSILFRTTLGLGFLIVGLMLFYPRSIRTRKTLFALRFAVWAYALISPLGLIATQVVHGLEYLFVMRKMANSSKFERWKSGVLFLLFLTVVFGVFRVVYYDATIVSLDQAPLWLVLIAALSTAFSFLHYYLDRNLFLMRKPTNQETVGRLLR